MPHWSVMKMVDDKKKAESVFNTTRSDPLENEQEGRAVGLDLWSYNKKD